jgi:hypothetical protein
VIVTTAAVIEQTVTIENQKPLSLKYAIGGKKQDRFGSHLDY